MENIHAPVAKQFLVQQFVSIVGDQGAWVSLSSFPTKEEAEKRRLELKLQTPSRVLEAVIEPAK